MSRLLFCVPIMHDQADMGSLAPHVRAKLAAGDAAWVARQATIAAFWKRVESWCLTTLPKSLARYAIYQDGLPVCGFENEIVRELAERGSANHRLVLGLLKRGARLEGTESPDLLLREYELAKSAVAQGAANVGSNSAKTLLDERDQFIAGRIDQSLQEGEAGVLFIGLFHNVLRFVPRSIDIQRVSISR